ncbi:MAG: hypothetical protein M3T56_12650 [Chloroflexota bacterium]|nr:hypothetical protein [Chloroflexota bacterium]
MTALAALAAPPSRDAQLAAARVACRRWVQAITPTERGPLWDVLARAVDRAEALGLGDESLRTFLKNAKRFHRYLHAHEIPEALAFEQATVDDYQLYVARLRKTCSVPPPAPGRPRTYKAKPEPRAARGNEPRLDIGTQKDIVDATRILWKAAHKQRASGFSVLPDLAPTAHLEWRDEEERDPARIELDLEVMLSQPFVPARGRSRSEHGRNLVLAHFYAAVPTRNAELREAVWEGLQVWKVQPGRKLPLARYPIEALLCGEVTLDQVHSLFLTLGGAVPTKSHTFRSVPLVGALAERVVGYAWTWVYGQLDAVRYLRYRARKQLTGALRQASFDTGRLELRIGGQRLTVRAVEQSPVLFRDAAGLSGSGLLERNGVFHHLTPTEAQAFRDLLWADAAVTRYGAAIAAFKNQTPIRNIFAGVFLPSRIGGVLGDKQMQLIWRAMGWTAKGWTAQHLRAHAAQQFEAAHLAALRPLGSVIGHKHPATTRRNYTGKTPYADLVVAEIIAEAVGSTQ